MAILAALSVASGDPRLPRPGPLPSRPVGAWNGWPVKESEKSASISCRPYSPHLNPIERLWGVMHRETSPTTNAMPASRISVSAILTFLREKVPRNWHCLLRPGHRQLPHHRPRQFSGSRPQPGIRSSPWGYGSGATPVAGSATRCQSISMSR